MRKVTRLSLESWVREELATEQEMVDSGENVATAWKNARARNMGKSLFSVLEEMAGKRCRCMYCNDSRGTDIEHFRPKAVYIAYAFDWNNMLLVCTGCNRKKSDTFPVDDKDNPLLIDPSLDDPWRHLVFIPQTGELASRWNDETEKWDIKGEATINPELLPLNIESVSRGRQKTFRNLKHAVERFCEQIKAGQDEQTAYNSLYNSLEDNSEYGLERWVFLFEGGNEETFKMFAEQYPERWNKLADWVRAAS
ncbi:MAG: hypothetical protein GY862_15905 [Gammaproteobacteria bacterium]|nr:hypothetical protein [Gammaproteobacteria bacterium]